MPVKKAAPAAETPALEGQISIDDFLSHDFDTLVQGEEEVHLGTDQGATWALRKLATLRKQRAANNAIAEEEANRIAAWLAAVNEPVNKQIAFVEGALSSYAVHERDAHDRKTIVLPYGKIATRPVADAWAVTDEAAFVAWALESGHEDELLKITRKPVLSAIKTTLTAAGDDIISPEGEPVPGVTFTPSAAVSVTISTL